MKLLAVVIAIAVATPARADDVTGVVFVAQPVRAPVAPDRVQPVAPFVPAGVGEVTGAIEVGPERAATLWLDALDIVAVRRVSGTGKLAFARVVGSAHVRATVGEPGTPITDGVTYLAQPPGSGDVWMITADGAATIRVERPVARDGRAIWDTTQRALLAWVDAGGARPPLPLTDGAYAAALRFAADADVGAAIEASDPALRAAVRAWRKASIVAELTAIRPPVAPQLGVETLALGDAGAAITIPDPHVPDPRPYQRIDRPRTYQLELEGPGALRVEARALLPAPRGGVSNAAELPDVTIVVSAANRALAQRTVAATYAIAEPALAAFPARQPLTSREGDTLGERALVTVPLFPGRHRYTIALGGGALAVRATATRLRPRMADAIGAHDVDELLADARAALGSSRSPAAALVRVLIADRAGARDASALPAKLPAALHAAWHVAAGSPVTLAAARRALAAAAPAHVWTFALALARRLPDGDAVRALYAELAGAPPASLVPELVALLPRATPLERIRNWSLAATALAARAKPVDPSVTSALRARWRTGEWMTLRPQLDKTDRDLPPPRQWVVEAEAQPFATPRAWSPGDLARITPGTPRAITVTASATDPTRAALLDVVVATARTEPGPLTITVDNTSIETLALSPVERVQLAVAPGKHTVSVAGPRSLRAWVSHVPATPVDATDRARVQSLWPAGEKFALPAGDLPLELVLRASAVTSERIAITLRADVGAPTQIELSNTSRDPRAHALDPRDAAIGGEVRVVVWPPRAARSVWLETANPAHVAASIATRRERSVVTPSPAGPQASFDLLDRVAAASRTLAADPDDAAARVRRARDLLDLGEPSLAREDLVRLLKTPSARRTTGAAEEELFARLDDAFEPTHVALATPVRAPVVIAPALAALGAPRPEHRAAALALRAGKPDDAMRMLAKQADPLASAIIARAHVARGDDVAGALALARAYRDSDRVAAALAAVELLGHAITRDATPGAIALAYGLASRTRQVIDHPRVRRTLAVAAAQSGWDTIGAMTASAGNEVVLATRPILPPAPAVLVREALVAPAWPARTAHTLTPGNAGVLDLALPASVTVRAQVHCVRVRSAELARAEATAPCELALRVNNGTAKPIRAPLGTTTDVAVPLPAGRNVVEVALAGDGDAASVRFVADRALPGLTDAPTGNVHPIRIERRAKLFVASATTPIATTVAGPTTLWVQARSLGVATSAEVFATPATGTQVKASIALPTERDPDARGDGRDLAVAAPGDVFLVLPDAVPYQIHVRPDRGELVARMALRDERRGKIPRLPAAWYVAALADSAPFALASTPTVAAIDAPTYRASSPGIATLSLDVRVDQDGRGDEDVASAKPGAFVESGLALRRALGERAWIGMRGGVRSREETALIGTASAELYIDTLPLGATFSAGGTAFTQDFSEGRAWHVRGRARLGARWALTDTLTARPSLGAGASYLNTTPEIAAVAMDRIDPDVYNAYRFTHDRDANAGFALQWMPLQDLVGHAGIAATTNASFASLDHAGATVGLRMLAPLPLVGDTLLAASYSPNYRLADAHRTDAYWRHDLSARVEWTLWTTTQGRFVLSAWNDYYPGTRNAFGAGLRFDLVRHRGLADFAPGDAPFASLVDPQPYAPLEAR